MLTFSLPAVELLDPVEDVAALPLLDVLLLLPHAAIRAAAERQAMTTEARRRRCIASTTFLAVSLGLRFC
jgi:hypothetical protein